MRVLIIEDEDPLRHLIRLTLEAAGYEVGEAADGETGLTTFGDGREWDAVLLDQRLPGIDGLETLRRLKRRDPDASVVMVTAYGSIELAVDAMKAGARDFLRKPVSPESLRGALKAALASTPTQAPLPRRRPTSTDSPFSSIRVANATTLLSPSMPTRLPASRGCPATISNRRVPSGVVRRSGCSLATCGSKDDFPTAIASSSPRCHATRSTSPRHGRPTSTCHSP
jgi:CheY-like chemotaxis protein